MPACLGAMSAQHDHEQQTPEGQAHAGSSGCWLGCAEGPGDGDDEEHESRCQEAEGQLHERRDW